MHKRSKVVLLVGFLIFAGGTASAAFLGSRSAGGGSSPGVEVLYAQGPVGTGTAASTALAQGLLRSRKVEAAAMPPGAITEPSQLSGQVAARSIPAGAIVTADHFAAPQTRIGTVQIPEGKRALALQLEAVPGVAGFVGAGDRVDVYSVSGRDTDTRGVKLVLQGVEVLNVNGTGLPSTQGQPHGSFVYLLAVTPQEAERLIYLTEFEKLYFDLIPKGEGTVSTPGAGPSQVLQAL
ncbi:MAG TPA: Flp pilus assembly protein CpaB [Acidimicrobiales bacterium]|nr:Flp pilus assembly protein CpaB [Acidimicrobiales bacterium]